MYTSMSKTSFLTVTNISSTLWRSSWLWRRSQVHWSIYLLLLWHPSAVISLAVCRCVFHEAFDLVSQDRTGSDKAPWSFPREDAQGYVFARGNVPLSIFARKRSGRFIRPSNRWTMRVAFGSSQSRIVLGNVQTNSVLYTGWRKKRGHTATDVYSHCTNRFEHHIVAVFSLGGATARWNF